MNVKLGWDCVTAKRDRSGRFVLPEMGALGLPSARGEPLPDRPAARRPGLNGAGFAGVPDAATGFSKGDARRYTGYARGGTTGRPGATIGLNTGTGQHWPGATRPTFGTADLASPATSPLFAAVVATVEDTKPAAQVPAKRTTPVAAVRQVASQISVPQVAGIVLASVLSYVLTQKVIAPRWHTGRR